MAFLSRIAGNSSSSSRFNNPALVCGAVLAMPVVALLVGIVSNTGAVDGAEAIFAFGDSFLDTGNTGILFAPYGSVWPGEPAYRWSDGGNQADYFAEFFGLPSPIPYLQSKNDSQSLQGVNFARSGAGVTFAYGVSVLNSQVDEMEALVEKGALARAHLRKSVAVVNIGVNDYDARNLELPFRESSGGTKELETTVISVVDGIAMTIVRLHGFGLRYFVVSNLPLMACFPLASLEFNSCTRNATVLNQTSLHNSFLQHRVRALNQHLRGVHIVIVDQTKAFDELFKHGSDYGFENPLTPCCYGKEPLYGLTCGQTDSEGKPMYTVCEDPSKAVLFDTIHPTAAAWKAAIQLYASAPGFTQEGPMLNTWIRKYNV